VHDGYIDLHTGGTELAVLPMACYMLHSDATVLEQQRPMARAFNARFHAYVKEKPWASCWKRTWCNLDSRP
jgi:predicted deacylase